MMPGVIRSCHFLDEAYHRFGSYGYRDCAFLHDIGTRLSIWLRHEFLRGGYKAKIDRGGWVPMDDIINEDQFWENVYFELKKYGHRRVDPGMRIYHDEQRHGQTKTNGC